jgi:hypothetical protein
MKVLGAIFAGILLFVTIIGLTWVVQGNEFFLYQYFAPKQAAVQRQVFENTKSYNQGMIQELQNMAFDYAKAPAEQKPLLAGMILRRSADYDVEKLPVDLRNFISDLRREQLYPTLPTTQGK